MEAAAENYGIGHHWPAANLHKHTNLIIMTTLFNDTDDDMMRMITSRCNKRFDNGFNIVLITLMVMEMVIFEIKEDMCVHPRGLGAAGPKYQMNLVATLYFDRGKGIFQWVCSCTIENGTLCNGRVSTESKQVSTRGRLLFGRQ